MRAAIHGARPGETISSICANHGIWDFGRFADQYRRLFGVLPSQNLADRRISALHERLPRASRLA
jgi:AraC family ethanolamine operon transcriptional activator